MEKCYLSRRRIVERTSTLGVDAGVSSLGRARCLAHGVDVEDQRLSENEQASLTSIDEELNVHNED